MIFLTNVSRAQLPAFPPGIPLTTATVRTAVNYVPSKHQFIYSYLVTNSKHSVGKAVEFDIDISTLSGIRLLGSAQMSDNASSFFAPVHNVIVPYDFVSQPKGWSSGEMQRTAMWSGDPAILPGQSLGAFILTSDDSLPGIRRFAIKPAYDSSDFVPGGIDDPGDMTSEQVVDLDNAIQKVIQSHGFLIGPVQLPTRVDIGQLLVYLTSLTHQAVSLGWIYGPGSDGIVQSLDAKLTAAKASAAFGDDKTAINQLNAFVNELQALRGKHFNDNAFYLLQANAQFILSKLSAP
ncbi:MAG: hypothetical protein HKL90_11285 [Elusimicrobia bacterium]|nr:hypothetical protein [Elusimicrobiota bacterium]